MKHAVQYTLVAKDPAAHIFAITVTVHRPTADGQLFSLPAWIPGSYMIREFARHIVQIRAESSGNPIPLTKIDKHTWQAASCEGSLTLYYEVYAWDLSVRAAHLDQTHGFFNGTSVFLRVHGQENLPHVVDIQRPEGDVYRTWRVATALPELKAKRYGFGTYIAPDYDALIDHPVEMGTFISASFKAHDVQHDIIITGRILKLDLPRLTADLKKICETQIALFEPKTKRAPMHRYVFLTMVVSNGYGGLEHRASTALLCARSDFPVQRQKEMHDGYRTFLGLCSHEYFHTWNVKRIKPAAFVPYDFQTENYTSLLWLFEGFTSYYDDLILVRSGVIDEAAYFKLIAKTMNGVLRGSGRLKQSVAESSFDAWIKYYRQDENAPNAIVSYYTKGSLIALALDLTIRAETKGGKSLDDVMRTLWQRYGRDFSTLGRGVTEAEVETLFNEVTGLKCKRFFDRHIRGTEDLPLAKLFVPFGITLNNQQHATKPCLDIRTTCEGNDCKLTHIYEGGAAHQAGLSAGDLLIAIDGLRISNNESASLETLLSHYQPGDEITLHAFRRDELMVFTATLKPDNAPRIALTSEQKPVAAMRMRHAWLETHT